MTDYRTSKQHRATLADVDRAFDMIAGGLALFWGLVAGGITMIASPVTSPGQLMVIPIALAVAVLVFLAAKVFLWFNYRAHQ